MVIMPIWRHNEERLYWYDKIWRNKVLERESQISMAYDALKMKTMKAVSEGKYVAMAVSVGHEIKGT